MATDVAHFYMYSSTITTIEKSQIVKYYVPEDALPTPKKNKYKLYNYYVR